MRISDWSSDVCSSDLETAVGIAVSSQLLDRLFQQSVRQVIEPLRYGQAHGRAEDEAGLSRRTLGGLAQQFYTGIGQQGVWADRKSVVEGKSVSLRVDLGGRRNHQKKTKTR